MKGVTVTIAKAHINNRTISCVERLAIISTSSIALTVYYEDCFLSNFDYT